jgi:hypothetical protein
MWIAVCDALRLLAPGADVVEYVEVNEIGNVLEINGTPVKRMNTSRPKESGYIQKGDAEEE